MDIMKRGVRMGTRMWNNKMVKSAFRKAAKKAGAILAALAIGLSMLAGCQKRSAPQKQDYKVVSQEQEGDQVHVVVSDEKAYALDMPIWDGRELTFSDGTVVSSEEYGEIVIRDQNGNEVDRYSDVERKNKNNISDYGIVDFKQDGSNGIVTLIFENEKVFKENCPFWDGRSLIFGKNDIPIESVGTGVKAYIVQDQTGKELATYIPDYESMSEEEYYLSRIIKSVEKGSDTTTITLSSTADVNDIRYDYDLATSRYIIKSKSVNNYQYEEEMSTRFLRVVDHKGNVIYDYDKGPDEYSDSLPSFVLSKDYDGMYLNVIVKNGTSMEELKDFALRENAIVFTDGTSIPVEKSVAVGIFDEAGNQLLSYDPRNLNTQPYVIKTMQDRTNLLIYIHGTRDSYKKDDFTVDGDVMAFIDGTKIHLKVENVIIFDIDGNKIDSFTVDLPDNAEP